MRNEPGGVITGLVPDVCDRRGPGISARKLHGLESALIAAENSNHIQKKGRAVASDVEKATAVVDDALDRFGKRLGAFYSKQDEFCSSAKKASSKIRESATSLSEGLAKIERTANFDRLERYVSLLERASVAMKSLADLEASGKLDKIASALK